MVMKSIKYCPIPSSYVQQMRTSMQDETGHNLVPRVLKHRALCRHCLSDGSLELPQILFSYRPFRENANPYAETGPVFVHEHCEAYANDSVFPPDIRTRKFLTVRAYSSRQWMLSGHLVEGEKAEEKVEELFKNPEVAFVHINDASTGCFFVEAMLKE